MVGPTEVSLFTPSLIVSIIGALVAALAFGLAWRKYREDSLRRGEVLTWANEVIAALEGLVIACIAGSHKSFEAEAGKRLAGIAFDSAILIERGRLFFRNQPHPTVGKDKKPAYRGLRPRVLDPLIAAHQISMRVPHSSGDDLIRLQCLAEDHLKDFVSLIQVEIGRERTASVVTGLGGTGFNLATELANVPLDRVELVRKMASNPPRKYREGAPGG